MPRDVIGTAYVRIIAMSSDFEKQVQRSFDKLKPMAAKSGEESSKAWTDGFTSNLDTALDDGFSKARDDQRSKWAEAGPEHAKAYTDPFGNEMGNNLIDHQTATTDEMGKNWADAGQRHGGMYGDPLSTEIDRAMGRSVDNSTNLWRNSRLMRFTLEDLQGLANDMPDILGGGADNSGRTMRQRFSGHFANIGNDLRNTFANASQGISATIADVFASMRGGGGGGGVFKWLTEGADAARAEIVKLITLAETLGSAMVALVAALANAVSGLFALAAAAGSAAPALAVIPGLIAAIAQAGLTMMVGFKGLGKAIQEGMKVSSSSMGATAARAKELETAQRAVANAARALQSAEESAARAKNNLKKAQQDLNDAYKEGAKQLRDIQYAAEDAALQEERSAINLADARDNLAKVKATNPADSRAVQEAELAYKEADLAYREARSRNKDASAEAADATKKGVKGTQAVTSAQDRLISAQQAVADSNQRVTDATIALADAQKNLAATQKGSIGTMKAYNEALAKFGPEGQKFIKTLIKMQPLLKGLKQAAGEGMFKAMNTELGQFASGPFFPMLKKNFELTSTAMGGVITRFSDMLQEGGNMSSLNRIMKSNTVVIGSMGEVATNLGQAFISITDAARPMTQEFAKWVAHLTAGWAATLKADNASGELTKKFAKASKVAKQFGRIFRNIWDAIYGTGQAATKGGGAAIMLNDLEAASKKWSDWVKGPGAKQLQEYFVNVAKGFKPLMEGLNSVVKELMKWGGNVDTVTAVGDGLKAIAGTMGWVGKQIDQVAPMFKGFADAMKDIFNVLNQSGSLQGFATVITAVAKAIAWLLNKIIEFQGIKSPWGQIFTGKQLVFGVGLILGVVRALSLLSKGFKFLFRGTIGKSILTITKMFGGLKSVLSGKSFFHGITKSSEEVRKEFQKQMLVDRLKKQAMSGVGEGADIATKALGKVDKASRLTRAVKGIGKVVKAPGRGITAIARSARRASGEDLNEAAGGAGPRSKIGGLLSSARDRRTRAVLDAQKKPSLRSRIGGKVGGIIADRRRKAAGNEGGFIFGGGGGGRNRQQTDEEDTPKTKRSSRLRAAGSKVGGGIKRVAGAAKGGMGKLLGGGGLIGSAISAVKMISSLNSASAGELGDTISGMLKNLPTALSALAGQVPKVISSIAAALGPMIGAVVKALPGVIDSIVKALPGILATISAALPKVIGALVKVLPIILAGLAAALPKILEAIANAFPLVIDAIANLLPKVIDTLVALFPKVLGVLVAAFPKIIGAIVKLVPIIIKALAKALPMVISAIAKALPLVIKAIVGAIPLIIGAIVTALPDVIKAITESLPLIVGAIVEAIPQIIGAIVQAIPLIVQAVVTALPLIWDALQKMWPMFQKIFTDTVPKIISGLGTLITTIISWIGTNGPSILAKLGEWTLQFIKWVGGLLVKMPIELAKLWLKIATWIAQQIPNIVTKVGEWVGAFLGWVGDLLKKIPGKLGEIWTKISNWIGELPGKIASAARSVWDGMFSGIKTAFMNALNWVIDRWNEMRFPSIEILGKSTPDRLPHIDRIKLAAGGVVMAQTGGVAATLAEAGRNEVVKPLDARGLTASDRLIVAMMAAQKAQMDRLVSSLTGTGSTKVAPVLVSAATTAAINATQRVVSASPGAGGSASTAQVATAIDHLTQSVDALQKPLVGGNLNVVSAPNEWAAESVPRALRRRAYTRGKGAR